MNKRQFKINLKAVSVLYRDRMRYAIKRALRELGDNGVINYATIDESSIVKYIISEMNNDNLFEIEFDVNDKHSQENETPLGQCLSEGSDGFD